MKRIVVLYNPVSGAGNAEPLARLACTRLRTLGCRVHSLATTGPGSAVELASRAGQDVDMLVVAGGDGSIREAISGLAGAATRVPVAILPCGNANVVARELGVPLAGEDAVDLLSTGSATPVALGFANSEPFLAMVGIGWDARTVRNLAALRRSRFGLRWYRCWADSAYLCAGLAALCTLRPLRLHFEVDGQALAPRFRAAVVANSRCYGKGWALVPDAALRSDRLHYQARKRFGFPFIAWQLLAARVGGRVPRLISEYGSGKRIVVRAKRPFPVQVDGDYKGHISELELEVKPAAARIVAPASGTVAEDRRAVATL